MIHEKLDDYVDGKSASEKDIAVVIGSVDDAVIFADDAGNIFFLSADPLSFEAGTIERKDALTPIEKADEHTKGKILSAVREGKD